MSSQTLRRMSSERQRASQNYNRRRGKVNSNTPPKARKKRFGLFSIGMGIDLPFLITILVCIK